VKILPPERGPNCARISLRVLHAGVSGAGIRATAGGD
jgi:hypothetical protein